MNKKEILAFLNAHPECHVATMDGNMPRVRGLKMHKADEKGLIFQVWTIKDVGKQLLKNPAAEVCFNDYEKGIQIRVNGKLELVKDEALKKEVMDARPFLKPFVDQVGFDKFIIFRMAKGKAHVYTNADNFTPKTWIEL